MRHAVVSAACAAFFACGGEARFEHDGPPCLSREWRWRAATPVSVSLDLLFVIDSANGSGDEQAAIIDGLPDLVDGLTVSVDRDGDAHADRGVAHDIHVGVITMDAGVQGYAVATCPDSIDGDDGILIGESRAGGPDCEGIEYPAYLSWSADDDGTAALVHDAGCLARVGDRGCRFRQPLESVRRALVEHAERANAGFERSDGVLALVLVTDADDCSTLPADQVGDSLFDTNADLGPLGVRCARLEASHLAPVDEFVEAVMALRAWEPSRLVAAAITGVPPDSACLDAGDGIESYDCLLAEPSMQLLENADGDALVPSCGGDDGDPAEPPRRIVSFLRGVAAAGGGTLLRSSCAASMDEPFQSLAERIGERLHRNDCTGHVPPPDDLGGRSCILRVETGSFDACPPGHIDLGWHGGGRRCQVCQRGDGDERVFDVDLRSLDGCRGATADGNFWEYGQDDECPAGTGSIRFHGRAAIPEGAIVEFHCLDSSC